MSKETNIPIMQDLADPASLISLAFRLLAPPVNPFDPDGDWTHTYQDISSFKLKQLQGELTLQHKAGGALQIKSFRDCPDHYRFYTIADLQCGNDTLCTPSAWTVETKVAKTATDTPYLNSGLIKQASVKDGVLSIKTGGARRTLALPGNYTCKGCLLDAVGRMARQGIKEMHFTLLDEYDEPCSDQVISFRGTSQAKTRNGTIEITCYQHTGTATIPGVFFLDASGRVLFYLSGMQMLALAATNGTETGYLK